MNRFAAILPTAAMAAVLCMAADPSFEAASVKIAPPDTPRPWRISGGPGTTDPGRFRAERTTLNYLLQKAYGVSNDQIDGPAWIKDLQAPIGYEVVATMPVSTTKEQFQKMLQNLLAERFHLVVHHETRHFPGYELVVDKGGPKFRKAEVLEDLPEERQSVLRSPRGPDGFPILRGPIAMALGSGTDVIRIKYQQRPLSDFIPTLASQIALSQGLRPGRGDPRPRVVDKTGLTGIYTFSLQFYCPLCDYDSESDPGNPGSGFPELFQAIQQQMGLRLVKKDDVLVDVIVADSANKTPTDN